MFPRISNRCFLDTVTGAVRRWPLKRNNDKQPLGCWQSVTWAEDRLLAMSSPCECKAHTKNDSQRLTATLHLQSNNSIEVQVRARTAICENDYLFCSRTCRGKQLCTFAEAMTSFASIGTLHKGTQAIFVFARPSPEQHTLYTRRSHDKLCKHQHTTQRDASVHPPRISML